MIEESVMSSQEVPRSGDRRKCDVILRSSEV